MDKMWNFYPLHHPLHSVYRHYRKNMADKRTGVFSAMLNEECG
ncbi:hypothetical protein [Pasteurella sp. PK-2025]